MVDIIIPIYKSEPSEDDIISLHQVFKILKNYEITIIYPKNLDISFYEKNFPCQFKSFDKEYFENISGYNKLMLSSLFYQNFYKKYILIYQTDAFVFRDELNFWINKDYDYIGAPWLRSHKKIPFLKLALEKTAAAFKTIINYKGNGKTQKDKSLTYNQVGNGGLSLRKRAKCIEILEKLPNIVEIYLKSLGDFYNEDIFWSIEAKRNGIAFSKPDYKEACAFSIENKQEKAMQYNLGKLPFACHRWNKERDFWRKYFEKEGYII